MSERRAFFGALSLSAVSAFRLAVQLLVLPIMARILGPEAYGLVGLAMPFILLANMMSDAGMGAALAREPNPSRALESTVFWIALGLGLSLSLLMLLASVPVASLFEHPDLAPIMAALSVILTIAASLSVPNARIMRTRRFELFAIGEAASAVVSAALGIAAAAAGWGAWSLVVQQLSLWITKLVIQFPVSGFKPTFHCQPSLARPFLSFGLHTIGASLADFTSKNIAPVIIGRTLGVTAVGHYALGWQLIRIPDAVISGPAYVSVFTGVSRALAEKRPVQELILRPIRLLIMLLAPIYVGLALVAEPAVEVVLGDKWGETTPVLTALCPAGFFLCLLSIVGAALMGLGRADQQFRLTLVVGALMAVGAFVGTLFGLLGVAIGLSVATLIATPIFIRSLARNIGVSPWRVIAGSGRPAIATGIMGIGVEALNFEFSGLPALGLLILLVVAGAIIYGAAIALLCRRQLIDDLGPLLPSRLRAMLS